jgi:hypothetical protein
MIPTRRTSLMNNPVTFNESNHTYWLNDGTSKQLISVTKLLKKHGITSNFENVDYEVLSKKADYGTLVHSEIEDYIKTGSIGFTAEFQEYLRLMSQNGLEPVRAEHIVNNDIVAGTYDLLAKNKDGQLIRIDYKTSYRLDKYGLQWQLSLYDYLDDLKADKFMVFHLQPQNSKSLEITPIQESAIKDLLDCERRGEIYKPTLPVLKIDPNVFAEVVRCEKHIETLKAEMEAYETIRKDYQNIIYAAMEKSGIKSFENDLLKITYVAPSTRSSIDTVKLKKDLPEIADKYTRSIPVKGSLRITVK